MAADFSALLEGITAWGNAAADEALRRLADDLDQACPVNQGESDDGRAPGTLRDSREEQEHGRGELWATELAYTDDAATWTDEGTDPHPIVPVNAKMLRWISAGGTVVFAREVMHPGTDGTRWWSNRVTDENWGELVSEALDAQGAPL